MRLSDLPERNAGGVLSYLTAVAIARRTEATELSSYLLKALISGNLGAVVLLVSVVVPLVTSEASLSIPTWAIACFLAGAFAAGVSLILVVGIAEAAINHISTSVEEFLRDERDVADAMKGYGFSPGLALVSALLQLSSAILFFAGIILAVVGFS